MPPPPPAQAAPGHETRDPVTEPSLPHVARIGVIGDVHAEDACLEAALAFLAGQGLDALLCVGDIVDGPGGVDRCCELLGGHGVLCVRGNRDRWFLAGQARRQPAATQTDGVSAATRAFLAGLPIRLDFETPAGPLLLCHGLGDDDMARVTPDDYGYALETNLPLQALIAEGRYRFVIDGHTHRRMIRKFERLTLLNAGALKHDENPCFMSVDFEVRKLKFHNIRPSLEITEGESFAI
jgi:predicted phosphodiesterase